MTHSTIQKLLTDLHRTRILMRVGENDAGSRPPLLLPVSTANRIRGSKKKWVRAVRGWVGGLKSSGWRRVERTRNEWICTVPSYTIPLYHRWWKINDMHKENYLGKIETDDGIRIVVVSCVYNKHIQKDIIIIIYNVVAEERIWRSETIS